LLEQASCPRRNCRRRKSGYENLEPTAGAAQLAEFELFARLGDQEGCDALVGSLLTLRVTVRLPVGLWRRQLGDRRALLGAELGKCRIAGEEKDGERNQQRRRQSEADSRPILRSAERAPWRVVKTTYHRRSECLARFHGLV
jgi:hypothetical protein